MISGRGAACFNASAPNDDTSNNVTTSNIRTDNSSHTSFIPESNLLSAKLSNDDAKRLIVHKGKEMFVMLNRYPYAAGHLMIIPYRHVMDITELTESENLEMIRLMQISCKVLRKECKPDGINMGINLGSAAGAGIADHLHFHVVPRWEGDSQFIAVLSDVRLIPEHLESTQLRFALAFSEIIV